LDIVTYPERITLRKISGPRTVVSQLMWPSGKKSLETPGLNYTLGHIGHTNNWFFKLVVALLQIHSCFFSHSILRGLLLLVVTVSLPYLPRCLRSTVTCKKTPTTTLSEPFVPCYFYAATNSRTMRSQASATCFCRQRSRH